MKKSNERRNKLLAPNEPKLEKARPVPGARTETEAVERALGVTGENERNRRAWSATEKLLRSRVRVRDVFGRLKD